jgi:hypothetical protein
MRSLNHYVYKYDFTFIYRTCIHFDEVENLVQIFNFAYRGS